MGEDPGANQNPTEISVRDPILDELTRALRKAEVQKTLAEAEKLRSEARGSWKTIIKRPAALAGFLAALLPGIAAVGTVYYADKNGYFDARQKEVGADVKLLDAQRKELEGEVKLLEAQKTNLKGTFDADKTLLEAQRERFAAQKELLQKDQSELDKKRAAFETDRQKLDSQIKALTEERDKLQTQIKQAAIVIPLETLLSDERKASFSYNENYAAIQKALKADETKDGPLIVEKGIERAKSVTIKSLLFRALYLATGDQKYLDNLVKLSKANWERSDQYFWDMFGDYNAQWPYPARVRLTKFLAELLATAVDSQKYEIALQIAGNISRICTFKCIEALDTDVRFSVSSKARDAVIRSSQLEPYVRSPAISLIFVANHFAARLILASVWQTGQQDSRWNEIAKGFIAAEFEPSPNDTPKTASSVEWFAWLNSHQTQLRAVLERPASEWPTSP